MIDGRGGEDRADYSNSNGGIVATLGVGGIIAGTVQDGFNGVDTLLNIERIRGSQHADTITGDAGNNLLTGEGGNDTIMGGGGNDRLHGGAGADHLDGGDENRAQGWPGEADWADYGSSTAGVVVNLSTGLGSGADATGDTLVNIENVSGSQFDDTLTGNFDDNLLAGGAGNDTLIGLDGNDYIEGGLGADSMDGGDGDRDIVAYGNTTTGVTVNLETGLGSGGEAEGDVFINFEGITGSFGDDTLIGNAGDNHFNSQAGNDVLTGNAGFDSYFFEDGDGNDTITDFLAGPGSEDSIGFHSSFGMFSFNDVIARATNDGSDVLIQLDGNDSLRLLNVQVADLHQDDFWFV